MLDFLEIERTEKKGVWTIKPVFKISVSKDLMIRGSSFYAIWDETNKMWSTSEIRAVELIDEEVRKVSEEMYEKNITHKALYLSNASNCLIDHWVKYTRKQMPDSWKPLDTKVIFSNTETSRKDLCSHKLEYPFEEGEHVAYDELFDTLYSPEERRKIEWAIGSILNGDSKKNQKFMVLYGSAGTGKSTILNIVQMLFDGYWSAFDAKTLGMNSASFALEAFSRNPLVAIQHDGDLSRIEDNTRLNSLVSHEKMTVNEKFKSAYDMKFISFLFMGTNQPVKITDAKSGILRRLIDVSPTGETVPRKRYNELMEQIKFELGAIAFHCRKVYEENPKAYDNYIPVSMMRYSNVFYNFIVDNYDIFKGQSYITLKQAWSMYKEYMADFGTVTTMNKMQFANELQNYYEDYKEQYWENHDTHLRNVYFTFDDKRFASESRKVLSDGQSKFTDFYEHPSILDTELRDCPAQYATKEGTPKKKWENVDTTLTDISTSVLHYVKPPENHIVIDFDIKDDDGNKSFEKNLEAVKKWKPTYAELSKSGAGIHLHYIYNGDVSKLASLYEENVEIKVFTGGSALRRKLSKCNSLPIATINSGLPLKEEKPTMINADSIKSEKGLRQMIERNLRKEIHPATKPSVDFIFKILEDAYNSGLKYDVTDMRPAVLSFATKSSNQADYCIKLVNKMRFKSEEPSEATDYTADKDVIIFYDVEVLPNLFVVVWKKEGPDSPCVKMINPSSAEIENLMKFKLVGFNNRRYDNHILYARMMGYSNEELFHLSQRIVSTKKGENNNCFFGEAYNISYTDIYDYSSKKQSLKKWEIELGIHHQELGWPWDKPVPEDMWMVVADYCCNDVIATEAVWNKTSEDFLARQILADLAEMTVNDTSNQLTTRIIFGKEKHPELIYTDLATGKQYDANNNEVKDRSGLINKFPGYSYTDKDGERIPYSRREKTNLNMYKGEDVGKGGLVRATPGMYGRCKTYDVASMHPHSITAMNMFGEYTQRFADLLQVRIDIKHKDYEHAKTLFGGKLNAYLDDPAKAKALSKALKIPINSVYGLTSASFENAFYDKRNGNNIVALRGALFMMDLRKYLENTVYHPIHIKTDSCKILNPSRKIEDTILEFGHKYGYDFEVEHVFDRICLVNDAVYIAKLATDDSDWIAACEDAKKKGKPEPTRWTATGTQFAVPYVFKTLFSHEKIEFEDLCETKSVKDALYLDMNEDLGPDNHNYRFIGKVGLFCPIKPGMGGGELVRENGKGGYSSAVGCKGYRWLEAEVVKELHMEDAIDISYYEKLAEDAKETLQQFGSFEDFVTEGEFVKNIPNDFMNIPEDADEEEGVPYFRKETV